MSISFPFVQIFFAGIIATIALDLWQMLVRGAFGIPITNWALVGRWVSYIPRGKLFHEAIGKIGAVPFETATGWLTHYAVGVLYALIYALVAASLFDGETAILTSVGFSLVALAAPWLLLQPGMGLGIFSRNAPKPALARIHTLTSHIAFGLGLYLGYELFHSAV